MTPQIEQWIDALKLGEYKQGYRFLRNNDTFCCLGVACDLYSKAIGGRWHDSSTLVTPEVMAFEGALFNLPDSVKNWLNDGTDALSYDYLLTLAQMNDRGATFKQIANHIKDTVTTKELKEQRMARLGEQCL